MLVSLHVCVERRAGRSLEKKKINMCERGREEKPSRIAGFLAINGQFPLGLFPEEQIVLKIDAGLGSITDIALPGAVHTSIPPVRS